MFLIAKTPQKFVWIYWLFRNKLLRDYIFLRFCGGSVQLHYIDTGIIRYDIAKVKICVSGDKNRFLQMHNFYVRKLWCDVFGGQSSVALVCGLFCAHQAYAVQFVRIAPRQWRTPRNQTSVNRFGVGPGCPGQKCWYTWCRMVKKITDPVRLLWTRYPCQRKCRQSKPVSEPETVWCDWKVQKVTKNQRAWRCQTRPLDRSKNKSRTGKETKREKRYERYWYKQSVRYEIWTSIQ